LARPSRSSRAINDACKLAGTAKVGNRPDRLNALSTPIMEGLLEALPDWRGMPPSE
jgi:hypothetical protein